MDWQTERKSEKESETPRDSESAWKKEDKRRTYIHTHNRRKRNSYKENTTARERERRQQTVRQPGKRRATNVYVCRFSLHILAKASSLMSGIWLWARSVLCQAAQRLSITTITTAANATTAFFWWPWTLCIASPLPYIRRAPRTTGNALIFSVLQHKDINNDTKIKELFLFTTLGRPSRRKLALNVKIKTTKNKITTKHMTKNEFSFLDIGDAFLYVPIKKKLATHETTTNTRQKIRRDN